MQLIQQYFMCFYLLLINTQLILLCLFITSHRNRKKHQTIWQHCNAVRNKVSCFCCACFGFVFATFNCNEKLLSLLLLQLFNLLTSKYFVVVVVTVVVVVCTLASTRESRLFAHILELLFFVFFFVTVPFFQSVYLARCC